MVWKIKGGVHPRDEKALTHLIAIEEAPSPSRVYLSLQQHIGAPLKPLVKVGQKVLMGEKIAEQREGLSAPLHASISGRVVEIAKYLAPINGVVEMIVIENDYQDQWVERVTTGEWRGLSKEVIVEKIKEAGIVGKGGAAFPTYAKLTPPAHYPIETLIINAAECEPYLTSDYRGILESCDAVIEGIEILSYLLQVKRTIIAIEDNKPAAITALKKRLATHKMEVAVLETKYPQGGEKQLIDALLHRQLPRGKFPYEIGVVVINSTTAKNIYEAIVLGKPMIDTVVTLSGRGYNRPKNVLARLGTRFKEIVKMGEIDRNHTVKLIMGGPMMGSAQYSLEVPIVKGTTALLALTESEIKTKKVTACIQCGYCVDVCPMKLHPLAFVKYALAKEWQEMERHHLESCIDCGCCAYICPANRPLVECIKLGKSKLKTLKEKRDVK